MIFGFPILPNPRTLLPQGILGGMPFEASLQIFAGSDSERVKDIESRESQKFGLTEDIIKLDDSMNLRFDIDGVYI